VTTQAELDAALAEGAAPVLTGRGYFSVGGTATVLARGFAEVYASDGASVSASERSIVRASGYAEVEATDDAEVHAHGDVTVRARGRSLVYAYEGATVFAGEQAVVHTAGPVSVYDETQGEWWRLCPLCGCDVDEWVCTNEDCGYILCSICADGRSGGSNTQDRPPCPHFAAMVWHDTDDIKMGIEATIDGPLGARVVLDDLTRAAGGVARSSVFLGSMIGSGAWTDYFVHDVAAFERRLSSRLDVQIDAVRPKSHTKQIKFLYHVSDERIESFASEMSRWGHGGIYGWTHPISDGPYIYRFDGPFKVYKIDDAETGSFHILNGFGSDDDFNSLLRELGPDAGLPTDGPPWVTPSGVYGIDYFRELHRLLRERLDASGFDGWWMGGEIVIWNHGEAMLVREAEA
jgi:hypothetical protein